MYCSVSSIYSTIMTSLSLTSVRSSSDHADYENKELAALELLSISDQDQAIHDQKSSSSHRPHQYQPRLSDEQREEIALMFVDQGMKAREIIEVFKRRGISCSN